MAVEARTSSGAEAEGRVPLVLKVVIAFLLALSACEIVLVLRSAAGLEELRREVLLQFILRGLLSLLALLLAAQLLLRIPYARACALILLVGFPGIKALQFVLFPLRWQTLGGTGRLQEFAAGAIFLAMAFFLFAPPVERYLHAREKPPPEPAAEPPPADAGAAQGKEAAG